MVIDEDHQNRVDQMDFLPVRQTPGIQQMQENRPGRFENFIQGKTLCPRPALRFYGKFNRKPFTATVGIMEHMTDSAGNKEDVSAVERQDFRFGSQFPAASVQNKFKLPEMVYMPQLGARLAPGGPVLMEKIMDLRRRGVLRGKNGGSHFYFS